MPKRKPPSFHTLSEIMQNPELLDKLAARAEERAERMLEEAGQQGEAGGAVEREEVQEQAEAPAGQAGEEGGEAAEPVERVEREEAEAVEEESGEGQPQVERGEEAPAAERVEREPPPPPQPQPAAAGGGGVDPLEKLEVELERVGRAARKLAEVADSLAEIERRVPGAAEKLISLVERALSPPQQTPPPPPPRPERVVIERVVPKPVVVRERVVERVEHARQQAEAIEARVEALQQAVQQAATPEEVERLAGELEEVRSELQSLRSEMSQLRSIDERVAAALKPVLDRIDTALETLAKTHQMLAEKIETMRMQGVYVGRIKRVYPNGVVEYDLSPEDEIDMKITKFITEEAGKALITELHGVREDLRYIGNRLLSIVEGLLGFARPAHPAPFAVPGPAGYAYRPTPRSPEQIERETSRIEEVLFKWLQPVQPPQQAQMQTVQVQQAAVPAQATGAPAAASPAAAAHSPQPAAEEGEVREELRPAPARILELPEEKPGGSPGGSTQPNTSQAQ